MGELLQGDVGPVDHEHQPRYVVEVAVEVDAALQLGGEADHYSTARPMSLWLQAGPSS
ncbi:hypothetical protein OG787_12095 [Streptomyces sp. NBC_00075]|uniref:hypothetical protein n=1 Tax=Streptomyces sp. NBC_00075 TaxID=2975641 RepID=UPI00324C1CB8